ncbi:MAG TPA: bifunctional homocysteine S-methyltransferase/methylenetetrahydrofolate reductase [Gemmatimonadaceae bacterium]|nr:bifunctional homocysteine S-methyltransferase/methylenetetrahydrofolate reductase [Gemmatimonadaceae bacterium]
MSSAAIDKLLDPERVVIFDGAMGTMLYSRGVFINQCYDELNVRAPDLVRDVHREYVAAGAEVLETNSFGANRLKLAQHGLEARVVELNGAAVALAREVADGAGRPVLVAGAVGPLGVRIEPYGPTSVADARAVFREQMQALKEGGADLFLLETFSDLHEIEQAIGAAREVDPDMPVIAQMTIGADCRTPYGATAEDVARALDRWGADVVGLNCSVGPQIILECIEKMAPVTRRKLSAQPNAGIPRDVGGRTMYMASPEYMATYGRHLIHAGAKILGGCCGTTPAHIRALVEGVRPLNPRLNNREMERGRGAEISAVRSGSRSEAPVSGQQSRAGASERVTRSEAREPAPFAERSRFAAKIAAGELVTSVEIVPPRGVDASRMIEEVRRLKEAGVDAVNVPDGPRAQSRMGALLTSVLIEQQVGIETVTHYACRDRNLLGMLSDLLGASAIGLRNLLIITGDPPKMGPYPDATAVFDIDSIGLTNLVRNLNRGLDPGGNAIGRPTCFAIGVGVNPAALEPAHELRRFEWKVDAGAEFAITQPVFDVAQLERFLASIQHVRIPIVAGIWPLVSVRNAEFLANEVPGVSVPADVILRMRRANERSKEHAVAEGIAIAREMLERVREIVQGVQVSAPFGKVEAALEVFGEMTLRNAAASP